MSLLLWNMAVACGRSCSRLRKTTGGHFVDVSGRTVRVWLLDRHWASWVSFGAQVMGRSRDSWVSFGAQVMDRSRASCWVSFGTQVMGRSRASVMNIIVRSRGGSLRGGRSGEAEGASAFLDEVSQAFDVVRVPVLLMVSMHARMVNS